MPPKFCLSVRQSVCPSHYIVSTGRMDQTCFCNSDDFYILVLWVWISENDGTSRVGLTLLESLELAVRSPSLSHTLFISHHHHIFVYKYPSYRINVRKNVQLLRSVARFSTGAELFVYNAATNALYSNAPLHCFAARNGVRSLLQH